MWCLLLTIESISHHGKLDSECRIRSPVLGPLWNVPKYSSVMAIVEIQPYTHLNDVDNSGNETEPGWLCWESNKCSQLDDVGMDCLGNRP